MCTTARFSAWTKSIRICLHCVDYERTIWERSDWSAEPEADAGRDARVGVSGSLPIFHVHQGFAIFGRKRETLWFGLLSLSTVWSICTAWNTAWSNIAWGTAQVHSPFQKRFTPAADEIAMPWVASSVKSWEDEVLGCYTWACVRNAVPCFNVDLDEELWLQRNTIFFQQTTAPGHTATAISVQQMCLH